MTEVLLRWQLRVPREGLWVPAEAEAQTARGESVCASAAWIPPPGSVHV